MIVVEWKSLILWTGVLYKHHEFGPKKEVNVELPKKCYSPYIHMLKWPSLQHTCL